MGTKKDKALICIAKKPEHIAEFSYMKLYNQSHDANVPILESYDGKSNGFLAVFFHHLCSLPVVLAGKKGRRFPHFLLFGHINGPEVPSCGDTKNVLYVAVENLHAKEWEISC